MSTSNFRTTFTLKSSISSLSVLLLPGLAALSSCNYSNPKSSPQALRPRLGTSTATVSYEMVKNSVFSPHCVQCHGSAGGVNLESYAEIFSHARGIEQEALLQGTMPPSSRTPLTAAEKELLRSWLDQGAPEFVRDPTLPVTAPPAPEASATPLPSSTPTLPGPGVMISYAQVKQRIFTPSCVKCHGHAGGVNLETYSNVKEKLELITREAITEKSMPPRHPLSDDDSLFLKSWIEQGAPEGDLEAVPPVTSPPPAVVVAPVPVLRVAYAQVRDQVFTPSCIRCHGKKGGVNLETYSNVKVNIDLVEQAVIVNGTMPPRKALLMDDFQLLKTWIEQGSPEN